MYKSVISDKLMRKVKIEKALLNFIFPYKIDKKSILVVEYFDLAWETPTENVSAYLK